MVRHQAADTSIEEQMAWRASFWDTQKGSEKGARYLRKRGRPALGDCGVASKGPQLSVAKLGSEQCSPQRGE